MIFDDVNHALPSLARYVMSGDTVKSRLGDTTRERLMTQITLDKPLAREVIHPARKASLPAQIAETMWILAGRNDVGWLSNYLPRAGEFSDDGKTWRAGYGPRIRGWHGPDREVDQLAHVVSLLRQDHTTRRAIISLYDPVVDSEPGKDIACNNWLHFIARGGALHLNVATRSNDLWWGWSGINQFEWSVLLELVAGMTGLRVGTLTFNITSLHLYERHWDRAMAMGNSGQSPFVATTPTPRLDPHSTGRLGAPGEPWETAGIGTLDALLEQWFIAEEELRAGVTFLDGLEVIKRFPEPMFQSWLRVVAWWWSQDERYLEPLQGTALREAALLSPLGMRARDSRRRRAVARDADAAVAHVQDVGRKMDAFLKGSGKSHPQKIEIPEKDNFIEFVDNLHREKGAAYGDSWKKRGEQISIQANIARKIDRLGVAGAGDTAADTVIDLLVYLIKYRLWLAEEQYATIPYGIGVIGMEKLDEFEQVCAGLNEWAKTVTHPDHVQSHLKHLVEAFNDDLVHPDNVDDPDMKADIVDRMVSLAGPLARRLWLDERTPVTLPKTVQPAQSNADRNATRFWSGYGE